jgi:uncharacterized membrane protein YqaE (UPF0057 family)
MTGVERAGAGGSDLLVEVLLFLCSYAPLFLILAIRFRDPWLEAACGVLFLVGLGGGLAVVLRYRAVSGQSWKATRVEDRGYEVAGYLASYLLPFVTVPQPGWRDLVGYAIFLAVAAAVYIRSGMLQVNPTLYLLGWRVFAVNLGPHWTGYALSRSGIAGGQTVEVRRVTDRVFMAARPDAA